MSKSVTKKANQGRELAAGRSLYFPTNQVNARGILSSGLLAPIQAYGKHYPDLLDLCHGRVPLFTMNPPPDAWQVVNPGGDESIFPVCIEVAPGSFSEGTVPSLVKGSLGAGSESDVSTPSVDDLCLAAPFFLPLSDNLILHFRSQRDLDEWNAREFGDLRLDDLRCQVTSTLFDGRAEEGGQWRSWLEGLPAVSIDQGLLENLDAAMGSLALLVAGTMEAKRGPVEFHLPFLESIPGPDSVQHLAGAWLESCGVTVDEPVRVILEAACSVLAGHDWNQDRRAAELFQRILDQSMRLATSARDLTGVRDKGISILRGESEMKPPAEGRLDGVSDVCRALLFMLQDPLPLTLVSRLRQFGESDQVHGLVLILAGALAGLSGLPGTKKPREIFFWLTRQESVALSRAIPGAVGPLPPISSLATRSTISGNSFRRSIVIGERELAGFDDPMPSLLEQFEEKDLVVSPYRDASVLLCRRMDWEDLIWSEIVMGPAARFEVIQGRKEAMTIRVNLPSVPVVYSVDKGPFLDRLAEHAERIPLQVQAEVMGQLGFGESLPLDGLLEGPTKAKAKGRGARKAKT
jgi:hypothetical protein